MGEGGGGWDRGNGKLLVASSIREVVKTTILKQDPANLKIGGGLCLYPLPQPQKMVSFLHHHPPIQQQKITMRFNPHFSCLSSNADSC